MNQQLTGIQVLRFVAAMLVVVMHLTQAISIQVTGQGHQHYWSAGSAGVDIFFVISGFVMAISTPNVNSSSFSLRLNAAWTFLKRRLLRVVPLYWFYTFLKVAVLAALPALATRSTLDWPHLVASLAFIPTLSPWGLVEPTLPVGWTLNFEMFFYLLFALAIALGSPRIRFCVVGFFLLFLAQRFNPDSTALTFFARSIIFEFILGMGIAYVCSNFPRSFIYAGLAASSAALLIMIGTQLNETTNRFYQWGLPAGMLVLGFIWMEPWISRIAVIKPLAFLGDASYSIYLSHTFTVPATVLFLHKMGFQNVAMIFSTVAVLTLLVGCFSLLYIERPLIRLCKHVFFAPVVPAIYPDGTTHAK